jgi:hypothetical protein
MAVTTDMEDVSVIPQAWITGANQPISHMTRRSGTSLWKSDGVSATTMSTQFLELALYCGARQGAVPV